VSGRGGAQRRLKIVMVNWANKILAAGWKPKLVLTARIAWIAVTASAMLLTVLMVIRAYLPVPIFDQWCELTGSDIVAHLFVPFNDHVIFFSRLVFLIDHWLFSASNVFSEFTILVLQLTTAATLAYVAMRAKLSAVFIGFIFIALFWAYQFPNFIVGFCVHNVGVFTAAVGAFAVLGCRRERGLVWALILGFVATLTWANGFLVGFLLPPLAYCLGLPRRHVISAAAGSAAMVAIFFLCIFLNPQGRSQSDFMPVLERIGTVCFYFGVLLGAPISRLVFRSIEMTNASLIGAAVLGYTFLALQIFLIVKAYNRIRLRQEPELLVLISVALFILGTIMIIAVGRAVEYPIYTAATGRYATPVLISWIVMILLAGIVLRGEAKWIAMAPSLVAGLLGIVMAASQPFILKAVITSPGMSPIQAGASGQYLGPKHLADRTGTVTAILSGVIDPAAFRTIYNLDDKMLLPLIERLHAAHLAPFNEAWAGWFGKTLPTFIQSKGLCRGTIDTLIPLPQGGWRVGGTFETQARRSNKILFLSGRKLVIGYGVHSPGRTLWEAVFNSNERWQGHISGIAGGNVTAYAFDEHKNSICELGDVLLTSSGGSGRGN
jgi:hypothetical protein